MKPDFNKENGLIPAIIQDSSSMQVLMLGYMNEEAFDKTRSEGLVTFFSRKRNKLWTKGESSGNIQEVKDILVDCDQDTIILKVKQVGKAACHEGYESCFFRKVNKKGELKTIGKRIFDPKDVYGDK